MNYQSYEDYMRSVLGYPINSPDIYEPYDYRNSQNYEDTYYQNEYVSNLSEEEIRGLYPEIYHLVYIIQVDDLWVYSYQWFILRC